MKVTKSIIVRDRGQITIPDKIRAQNPWLNPSSVVDIVSEKDDEIIIRPHRAQHTADTDALNKHHQPSHNDKDKLDSFSQFMVEDR